MLIEVTPTKRRNGDKGVRLKHWPPAFLVESIEELKYIRFTFLIYLYNLYLCLYNHPRQLEAVSYLAKPRLYPANVCYLPFTLLLGFNQETPFSLYSISACCREEDPLMLSRRLLFVECGAISLNLTIAGTRLPTQVLRLIYDLFVGSPAKLKPFAGK